MDSAPSLGWWVTDTLEASPMLLVAWVFWVIVSITLHELAHGWAAIHRGDRTPIELGRMTLNPIVHMGPMSLIVFAIVGIAWGSMPVRPERLRGRHADAAVAAAGPMMNISLAVVSGILAALTARFAPADTLVAANLFIFFFAGCWLNILLAMFNLLPAPPLDGSRILASFFPGYRRLIEGGHATVLVIGLLVLVFLGGFEWMQLASTQVASWWIGVVAGLLP